MAETPSHAVIELRDLYRIYEMGDQVLHALDGVDIDIHRNEYVAVIGASGSGKSTLMNIIGCLDRASRGEYRLEGTPVGLSLIHISEPTRQLTQSRLPA